MLEFDCMKKIWCIFILLALLFLRCVFVLLVLFFLFRSCSKFNLKCNPIAVEQIFGTYDLGDEGKITLKNDFFYVRFYTDNSSDTGIWWYQSFKSTKTNEIRTYDMRAISEDGERNYYSRYMTNRFFACKHWGNIIISRGYAGDPDGAPALKWFKKIE